MTTENKAPSPVAPVALLEAIDYALNQAPCKCPHSMRFERGEHMSGCYLFDLNAEYVKTAAIPAPEGAPQLSSGDLLDLHYKHAPDCPTEQAVALGQAVMQRLAAQPQALISKDVKALRSTQAPAEAPATFPAAIWQLLLTVADRKGTEYTGPWEGPNGEPLQDDADAAMAWIMAAHHQPKGTAVTEDMIAAFVRTAIPDKPWPHPDPVQTEEVRTNLRAAIGAALAAAVPCAAPAHPQLWRDGGTTELDPHKCQLCRVGVHSAHAMARGQNCNCAPGTCRMWNGGLRPAVQAPAVAPELVPDMFWDGSDGERFGHDIPDIIADYGPGEIVVIARAKRLPRITVRVVGDSGDYEVIPAEAKPPVQPQGGA